MFQFFVYIIFEYFQLFFRKSKNKKLSSLQPLNEKKVNYFDKLEEILKNELSPEEKKRIKRYF